MVCCLWRSEGGVEYAGTGKATISRQASPCECWKSNPGSVKQAVLLTSASSLPALASLDYNCSVSSLPFPVYTAVTAFGCIPSRKWTGRVLKCHTGNPLGLRSFLLQEGPVQVVGLQKNQIIWDVSMQWATGHLIKWVSKQKQKFIYNLCLILY